MAADPVFSSFPTVFFSYPPAHWFELALPRLVRDLRLGPEDPYWYGQQTTGFEAALYLGTIPLILAIVALVGRPASRHTMPWRLLIPIAFAVATMPRWWPRGYLYLHAVPGFGSFRVPARYALLSSLGAALLAGEGFERSIGRVRFRLGLAAALIFGACATIAAANWSARADVHLRAAWGIPDGFLWALLAWSIALAVVLAWRSGRLGSWAPLAATAVELGILYYAGTTQWGWSIAIPAQSPVLSELVRERPAGLVGGEVANLPVRAGLATASPQIGFKQPHINRVLAILQEQLARAPSPDEVDAPMLRRWLRRCRVTHLIDPKGTAAAVGEVVGRWRDPALDRLAYRAPGEPASRAWSIVRVDDPFPEARVAARARTAPDLATLVERLSRSDDRDVAWFVAEDRVPARPDARLARLTSWDGASATVEHDGPCDLVIGRTFDPGWLARRRRRPGTAGPLRGRRVPGRAARRGRRPSGEICYRTPRFVLWSAISIAAAVLEVATAVILCRPRRPDPSGNIRSPRDE